jgi:hypothetical protein
MNQQWKKEFDRLDALTRQELVSLQEKLNDTIEGLDNGIGNEIFIALFKDMITKAIDMNQIYGVLRYTQRWNDGKIDRRTDGTD